MPSRRLRLSSLGLVCLLTLLTSSCASLPVPKSEPFVTIGGKTFESGDYLPSGTEAWRAKEEAKGAFDAEKWAIQVAMDRFRYTALLESARLMLPQCNLAVDEVERVAFIAWWRNDIRRQMANLQRSGGSLGSKSQAPERIYTDNETVREIADDYIVEWKLYACLQSVYGGTSFFQPESMASPLDPDAEPFAEHKMVRDYPVPLTAQSVEPLEAAGRHMVKAISIGVIRFTKLPYQRAMLTRYADVDMANIPSRDAVAALRKPPWK